MGFTACQSRVPYSTFSMRLLAFTLSYWGDNIFYSLSFFIDVWRLFNSSSCCYSFTMVLGACSKLCSSCYWSIATLSRPILPLSRSRNAPFDIRIHTLVDKPEMVLPPAVRPKSVARARKGGWYGGRLATKDDFKSSNRPSIRTHQHRLRWQHSFSFAFMHSFKWRRSEPMQGSERRATIFRELFGGGKFAQRVGTACGSNVWRALGENGTATAEAAAERQRWAPRWWWYALLGLGPRSRR